MTDLAPNHHAHYRQFSGAFGYLAGLTMIVGRGRDARLVAGNASHGWTPDQADTFAAMLTDRGFTSADVSNHDAGRRHVVVVTGRT